MMVRITHGLFVLIQTHKHISLVICLKRFKDSSLIPKLSKHVLARKFDMSPVTFSRLLQECIELGYIVEDPKVYRIIKFSKIVYPVLKANKLFLGKHEILRSDDLNFKSILNQLQTLLVIDNVIKRQEHKIKQKHLINLFFEATEGTDKKQKELWFSLPFKQRISITRKALKNRGILKCEDYKGEVITSCRSVANILGICHDRANDILNQKHIFIRDILVKWVYGFGDEFKQLVQQTYKRSFQYGVVYKDGTRMIKVCFGSEIRMNCF
jgi:hypothetical protein